MRNWIILSHIVLSLRVMACPTDGWERIQQALAVAQAESSDIAYGRLLTRMKVPAPKSVEVVEHLAQDLMNLPDPIAERESLTRLKEMHAQSWKWIDELENKGGAQSDKTIEKINALRHLISLRLLAAGEVNADYAHDAGSAIVLFGGDFQQALARPSTRHLPELVNKVLGGGSELPIDIHDPVSWTKRYVDRMTEAGNKGVFNSRDISQSDGIFQGIVLGAGYLRPSQPLVPGVTERHLKAEESETRAYRAQWQVLRNWIATPDSPAHQAAVVGAINQAEGIAKFKNNHPVVVKEARAALMDWLDPTKDRGTREESLVRRAQAVLAKLPE